MVCTYVGQAGIDRHRHCRSVIQDALAWNPAVVEQRTGTYDERMYADLRIRAQAFEVLTGGDVTADDVTGSDEAGAEARAGRRTRGFRSCPCPRR